MGFRVRVSEESFHVEPGVAASVSVEVKNEGTSPITAEISVEGIDPEWIAIPVPMIDVPVGESITERVFLKPPREPESIAGTYPFVVRARRVDTEESEESPSSLVVKPFYNVSVDVQPRRAEISTFNSVANVQVTVMNLGNVESTLRLSASDIGDMFAFAFDEEEISVAPGAQRTVAMEVTPVKNALFANPKLQQITVTCRSRDEKTVATATHAQVEQRGLLTPIALWFAALLVFIVFAFVLLLPRNPTIDTLTISPERQWMGEQVEIKWTTSNARSVTLRIDDEIYENLDPNGTRRIVIDRPGELTSQAVVELVAYNGRRVSPAKNRLIVVQRREAPPDPEILEFKIDDPNLILEQPFSVTYKLSDSVYEAYLLPTGIKFPNKEGILEVVPTLEGDYDYKIVAKNEAGQTVERSIPVHVKRGSQAKIIVFRAEPAFFDPLNGTVTLTWQVTNALRVELIIDATRSYQLEEEGGPQLSGSRTFGVSKETTFTLRVYDSEGATAEVQATVKPIMDEDFIVPPIRN